MNELRDAPLVNCQHWSEHRCSLGLYGGKPQLADCSKCPQRLSLPGTRPPTPKVRQLPHAIPENYNPKNWRLDSRGNAGCGCSE